MDPVAVGAVIGIAIYIVLVLAFKGDQPEQPEPKTLDQLWDEYVAEHPDPRSELQKQLDRDWLLYGNIFLKREADGSITRLDPTRVVLVVCEDDDDWDPRTPQANA